MDLQQGPPPQDVLIGQTIGNYLVTQKVGEGGMGSVYLAEHPSIGKKVALKVLHAEFSANAEVIQRFFTEAKAVNDIAHPNIVDIVDYGVIQNGRESLVYFIMEYLAGMTLSQLIRSESPMVPERALGICMQVADALAASHKCGIVHRDLKPDNIILAQRGRERDFVKLLDFGIAKLTGPSGQDSNGQGRTRTGIVMGTPAYMSPEQCEGRATVDHRTDIYALGVVLYEMLTGRVPFIGEGYGEILVQHLTQIPIPPSQYRMLPPHVEIVVLKALEKRADMRYPTMDEFMRAMADPVGFVEAHGGLGGFLQRQLMPSTAPLPPISRLTPAPMMGTMPGSTPVPGSLHQSHIYGTPTPTTMGAAAGQVGPPKSKAGFILAGVFVVALAAVAIVVVIVTQGNKGTTVAAGDGSNAAGMTGGSNGAGVTGSNGSTAGTAGTNGNGSSGATAGTGGTGSNGANGSNDTNGSNGTGSNSVTSGSNGATTGSNGTGSNGSAATVESSVIEIELESTPPGAAIYVDGFKRAEVTPAKLKVPKGATSATIVLKLKGYVDDQLPTVALSQNASFNRNLRKVTKVVIPQTGKGSGSSTTTGGHHDGLAKPGED